MSAGAKFHAYRPDVDGLRAVAVLAVLAFHAFPAAAPGGFAGVDVFFVISGFLISGIIFEGLRSGGFTFVDFYRRRVRRIFPALALVLVFCVGAGWLVLLPDEFSQLGKHVAAGAGFLANVALWREAGYFDVASELKPLLHLWSLGVEEQYYLVWPLLLFALRKRVGAMLWVIAAIAAASFAANLWLTSNKPVAAFYLPAGRFWELLAGSLLAYFAAYRTLSGSYRDLKACAGAAMVLASFLALNAERAFPGAWALLPVIGTMLVIWSGPSAWINRNILSRPSLVFIGLISYPLYLWHWPLLTYARIAHGAEPPPGVRLALCALSALLAWLTYALVEKRIRFSPRPLVRRIAVPGLAASMAVLAIAGLLALQAHFRPQSASVPLVREISAAYRDWEDTGDRVIPGTTGKAVLFLGDSHMQHYLPRVRKVVHEAQGPVHTVIFKTSHGCAPVPGIERRGGRCGRFVAEGLQLALAPEVATVVIAASWVGFLDRGDYYRIGDPERKRLEFLTPQTEWVMQGFEAALGKLVRAGKQVVIVLSSPRGDELDPKSVITREGMTVHLRGPLGAVPRREFARLAAPIDQRLRRIAADVGATLIDPAELLCTPSVCPGADESGRPLYKDATHLRASVARERFDVIDRYIRAR